MITLHPASLLAANWLSQLQDLNSSLEADPSHPSANFWRIRLKVLTFLISRYGNEEGLDFKPQKAAIQPSLDNLVIYNLADHPLRSRATIRKTLDRIAEANRLKMA